MKSHELNEESRRFNDDSSDFHRKMRWRNIKNYLILGGAAIIAIFIIWMLIK